MGRIAARAAAACLVGLVSLAVVAAQEPTQPTKPKPGATAQEPTTPKPGAAGDQQKMPTPGPEAQKLGSMVGSWKDESHTPSSEFGPAGTWTGTSSCEWFDGKFQVVCRGESTGPTGKITSMAVFAWHQARKTYVGQVINNLGMAAHVTGTLAGNTWTWTDEGVMEGQPVKFRVTIVEESPTVQTSKVEVSRAGGDWTVVEEAKSTKVK